MNVIAGDNQDMGALLGRRELRTNFIDPDYRRDPKTKFYCARCQKDLKEGQPRRWVHLQHMSAIHPSEEPLAHNSFPDDYGWWPVGMDCAKAIGLEWTHERPLSGWPDAAA